MSNYSDPPGNFKLIEVTRLTGISRRNIGILAMWLSGLGIPEPFHEFVTAVFVSGNWDETDEDEITLKRMARAISPGTDGDESIRRAYERLKKSSLKFFDWQGEQEFEIIPREISNQGKKTKASYRFPHYQLLTELFNLPETSSQKQIRAEVAKALGDLMLPSPKSRKKKERSLESIAIANARTLQELLAITSSPSETGMLLSDAWRKSLNDVIIKEMIESLMDY